MCLSKKKKEQKRLQRQKELEEPFTPEEQKKEASDLLELCRVHIDSIRMAYEKYTDQNINYEERLRSECLDNFYKIKEYYVNGDALNNVVELKLEIDNVANMSEFLRIFNKARELGTASVNHLTYLIQSSKIKSQR